MKRILLLSLLLLPIFVIAQYPTFSNKQRLGVQTTGDGLIFRGTTINNIPNYTPSNVNNAYFHLDTVHNKLYLYNATNWQLVYPTSQFDTTTLNVYLKLSDTTSMLLPYFRDSDTTSLNLINRFALKLNISDTVTMLTPYMKKADTISLSDRINLKLNISDTIILSNRITTNANNIITINNKLATKLDTIYTKFKNVVTMIENKDTINIGSSLTDGYAINIIGDSVNVDTTLLDIRYPDRDSTNELQDMTFSTTAGIITISGGKVMNLDTLYNSMIDSVNLLIKDSIAAFTPITEGYGINIIGDSINIDTTIIFTQSDTITLSNRIDLKLNTSDTITLSNRVDTKLNASDTVSLSNRIDLRLNISDTTDMLAPYLRKVDTISLSNRINTKLDTIYVNYQNRLDTITNKDTINITRLTEGFGINIIADSINIDSAVILTTQQKQIAYVKNQSGVTMYKGQAVYSSGSSGENKLVSLASSSTEQLSSKTFGVVESDVIPNDGFGYIITFGLLNTLNTNSLTEGSSIYLSTTPGELTTTKPIAPLHLVTIGVCIRKQQNNGSIFVKIQNGFELNEIHDVRLTDVVNKASLYYNLSENLWRDTTAALLVSDTTIMLSNYVNTYSNQTGINGNKAFNNIVTIDSATVTGKLLVNTNTSDAVKISSNTNSTNLELANNSGNSVFIKSTNRNMVLQTDTTALMYLNGENNKVGILTMNPEQALEVNGTIRVDSLVNDLTPDKLVGANNSNDLTDIKIGNGLSFLNDTLKVDDNIINSGDTATLLRKDYYSITTNKLIWTEGNKKLIPYFTQVYRNGQLLKLEEQYFFSGVNNDTITLEEGSYKLGNNITIIAIDNIVALAGSGGMITLQGDVSGSGTNSISTTIGVGKVTNTMLAGNISDNKLNTITTVGKVSNSATTATDVNTNSTIVSRSSSGNFSAGTITASLNGNANTSTTATIANGVQSSLSTGIIKLATSANAVQPVITVPNVNATMATTNLAQTFTEIQTFSSTISGSINGNASTVTTNANLTGDITSTGNNTSIASGVIVNADINTNAAIAVSKLAASTISGVTLGNSLNTLTISSPLTGTSYNGSSAVSIGLQAATTSVAGSMSAADKNKLDGIASGATANTGTVTSVAALTLNNTGTDLTSSVATGTTTPVITLNVPTASSSNRGVLSSTDWTTFNGKQNALGFTPANSVITISTTPPLQGGGNLTADRTLSILSASDTQSGIVTNASQLFGGSKVFKNRVTVDSVFTLNTTTAIPNQILGINTTGNVNSVGKFTLGNGLSITSSTLLADTNLLVTRFDTASMLANYLRTGVAASTYVPLNTESTINATLNINGNINMGSGGSVTTPILSAGTIIKQGGTSSQFLKANGDVDSNTYLTTGTAASTYLPLTGGTLTGGLAVATTGVPFTVNSTNSNSNKISLSDNGIVRSFLGANNAKLFTVANTSTTEFYSIDTNGANNILGFGVPLNINSLNSNINKIALYDNGSTTGYIASNASKPFVVNNNSLNEVFYVTEIGNANFTGNITEAGNNVLTNLDTASLSSRINAKYNISGGTISGAVTLSTTSATPTALLGKDVSNVVGTVTTVAQTGLFGRGSITNEPTNASGNITVAHGFGFTPIMAFANLPGQTVNIVNVKEVDANNITFVVRNGETNAVLNSVSVAKIEFFGIK